ncbi:MAG TPA: hypothetical protein VFG18_00915 [Xanthomonadaceae bacterium]|nr:hypothetical protein [Xanthomonadaceae bacterium]
MHLAEQVRLTNHALHTAYKHTSVEFCAGQHRFAHSVQAAFTAAKIRDYADVVEVAKRSRELGAEAVTLVHGESRRIQAELLNKKCNEGRNRRMAAKDQSTPRDYNLYKSLYCFTDK